MDFHDFAAKHYPALSRDEIRHNVMLAIMKRGQRDQSISIRFWDLGQPGSCALQQQGYGIVLGDVDPVAVRRLVSEVAGQDIPRVMGADDTASWFVAEARRQGTDYPDVMEQTIHVLDHPPRHPRCDGEARLATAQDADLVCEWLQAFVKEAVPEDHPPTLEDARQRIENKRVSLWCVDQQPVSMSSIGRQLDTGVAIAPVYTPPEHRCRGYAGAITAALVEEIFERGYRYAYLFTDDTNLASNRCYAKIGFRPYCKANMYLRRVNDKV